VYVGVDWIYLAQDGRLLVSQGLAHVNTEAVFVGMFDLRKYSVPVAFDEM
jgi:hypothetical protein